MCLRRESACQSVVLFSFFSFCLSVTLTWYPLTLGGGFPPKFHKFHVDLYCIVLDGVMDEFGHGMVYLIFGTVHLVSGTFLSLLSIICYGWDIAHHIHMADGNENPSQCSGSGSGVVLVDRPIQLICILDFYSLSWRWSPL